MAPLLMSPAPTWRCRHIDPPYQSAEAKAR